ncbi:hypothetical protein ADH76_06680 [Enterocloster clostridioformis]|nr:hypothetical protein A4V08_33040 [Lachnoclostridium sp. YL32]NDO32634.1 thioesterase [Enterocloster clostridioformis]OXE71008.1 hypothetical protein ADH76_06680 [Enterocloster clostridioformis]
MISIGDACMNKIKLFCLAYSGATALIYYKLQKYLSERIEIVPIDLPGRGTRMDEKLLTMFDDSLIDVEEQINKKLGGSSYYAVFGYSLGAVLAFEVIQRLSVSPLHLFLAARQPPHVIDKDDKIAVLPDEQFLCRLISLGGMSPELLNDKRALEYYLPIIRADFELVGSYEFNGMTRNIDNNSTILFSQEDSCSERIMEWSKYLSGKCEYIKFKGDHFFINREPEKIAEIISAKINEEIENLEI